MFINASNQLVCMQLYWQFENTLKDWACRSGAVIEIIFLLYISITDKIFRGFLVIWLLIFQPPKVEDVAFVGPGLCFSDLHAAIQMGFHKSLESQKVIPAFYCEWLKNFIFQISKKSKACQLLNMFSGPEWINYKNGISHFFLSKHWSCWGGTKEGHKFLGEHAAADAA